METNETQSPLTEAETQALHTEYQEALIRMDELKTQLRIPDSSFEDTEEKQITMNIGRRFLDVPLADFIQSYDSLLVMMDGFGLVYKVADLPRFVEYHRGIFECHKMALSVEEIVEH